MATIPIEVIIQDAESPVTPTPESGEETNITVPDTGTISSNGDTGSSVSSIVLPAILLVLAIGSIVAILIHKYHKQKNNKTTRKEKLAVVTSSTIAVLVATVLVSNLILPATKAATSDIEDGITLSEDKVSIVVTRDGGVAEASIESTATITSTSDFGYKVLLSMAEGVGTSNLYLDGDITSQYYIAPVEAESEEEVELADNTWGFALTEDGGYSAIPLLDNAATVAQGDEPVEDEALSIYYGVKVSSDLPAGTYSGGEISYSLEGYNGFPSTLTTMQGMTHEICESVYTPNAFKADGVTIEDNVPTAMLIDVRDNKTYTIAKLADGKCWMTQNLDLNLSTETTLTPSNTDITANWTPLQSTFSTDLSYSTWYSENNPRSYDAGDVYYYASDGGADDTPYNSLVDCVAANHIVDDCNHYHAGNYYNWTAAIASNDSSEYIEQHSKVGISICPKGWRLPIGSDNPLVNNEFGVLINDYGILGEPESCGESCTNYAYKNGGFSTIRKVPLWLARSGMISYGRLGGAGHAGSYWTSTFGDSGVYGFEFGDSLYPNVKSSRDAGKSVRCVAE